MVIALGHSPPLSTLALIPDLKNGVTDLARGFAEKLLEGLAQERIPVFAAFRSLAREVNTSKKRGEGKRGYLVTGTGVSVGHQHWLVWLGTVGTMPRQPDLLLRNFLPSP